MLRKTNRRDIRIDTKVIMDLNRRARLAGLPAYSEIVRAALELASVSSRVSAAVLKSNKKHAASMRLRNLAEELIELVGPAGDTPRQASERKSAQALTGMLLERHMRQARLEDDEYQAAVGSMHFDDDIEF